jgi:hypothetical protein
LRPIGWEIAQDSLKNIFEKREMASAFFMVVDPDPKLLACPDSDPEPEFLVVSWREKPEVTSG